MKKAFFAIILLITALIVFCSNAFADIKVTQTVLRAKNINLIKFGIIALSGDGRILAAFEKVSDVKQKQKGFVYNIWIIESDVKNRDTVKFSKIPLPIYQIDQMALSNDGKTGIVTANGGATFLELDIQKKKAKVIFDHKRGVPGFRADTSVTYYFNGNFYLWGYFYNEENRETKRAIVMLDLSKSGIDIFKFVFDTKDFQDNYGNARYLEWFSPDQCVIFGKKSKDDKDMTLAVYDKGTLKEIDRGYTFTGVSAAANRILYCIEKERDKTIAIIKDIVQDKTWTLNKSPMPFSYTSLSRDGKTAIVTIMDIKKKTSTYYYAMEKDNFQLKLINPLANSPFSAIRLAPFGTVYATFDGNDIYWGNLE